MLREKIQSILKLFLIFCIDTYKICMLVSIHSYVNHIYTNLPEVKLNEIINKIMVQLMI